MIDEALHELMETDYSRAVGRTEKDCYRAFYHERCLYSVENIKSGIVSLVYAENPYDAIEKIKNMSCEDYGGDSMRVKIKLHADINMPKKIGIGDWVDLRAAEDVFIPLGEYKLISLGVSMELPKGYEAYVLPRSSTFKNFGIMQVNNMGVIDNSYRGDNDIWHFPAYCNTAKCVIDGLQGSMIHKNDRICQFRIVKKMPEIIFEKVEHLGNKDRGGLGSTGTK